VGTGLGPRDLGQGAVEEFDPAVLHVVEAEVFAVVEVELLLLHPLVPTYEPDGPGWPGSPHEPPYPSHPRIPDAVFVADGLYLPAVDQPVPGEVGRQDRAAEDDLVEPDVVETQQRVAEDIRAETMGHYRRRAALGEGQPAVVHLGVVLAAEPAELGLAGPRRDEGQEREPAVRPSVEPANPAVAGEEVGEPPLPRGQGADPVQGADDLRHRHRRGCLRGRSLADTAEPGPAARAHKTRTTGSLDRLTSPKRGPPRSTYPDCCLEWDIRTDCVKPEDWYWLCSQFQPWRGTWRSEWTKW
jgi:hypothetical protein